MNIYLNNKKNMYKEQQYASQHKQSPTNCSYITIPTLWQSSTIPQKQFLSKYRKKPQKPKTSFHCQPTSLLSSLFCNIFHPNSEQTNSIIIPWKCRCDRTTDDRCKLVMKWVEEHYFWRTDRQFVKVYQHYSRKKQPQCEQQIHAIVSTIAETLNLSFQPSQMTIIVSILCNYIKHTLYYSKADKLIKQSNIFVWIGLALIYHMGIQSPSCPPIIFWAIDIAMNTLGDVSAVALQKHSKNVWKLLYHYFPKWMNYLEQKQIRMGQVIDEWVGQMMMGYMGTESILFFVDCFMKVGWNYLYKVILSYFQHRTQIMFNKQSLMQGSITEDQILTVLIGGENDEWPMIFCATVTFNFQDKVPL